MRIKWGHTPKPKSFSIPFRYANTAEKRLLAPLEKGTFKRSDRKKMSFNWGKLIFITLFFLIVFKYLKNS